MKLLKPIWTYGTALWGAVKATNILRTYSDITIQNPDTNPIYVTNHILHRDLNIPFIHDLIPFRFVSFHDNPRTSQSASEILDPSSISSKLNYLVMGRSQTWEGSNTKAVILLFLFFKEENVWQQSYWSQHLHLFCSTPWVDSSKTNGEELWTISVANENRWQGRGAGFIRMFFFSEILLVMIFFMLCHIFLSMRRSKYSRFISLPHPRNFRFYEFLPYFSQVP